MLKVAFNLIVEFAFFYLAWHFLFGLAQPQSIVASAIATLAFGKLEQIILTLDEIKDRQE